MCAFTKAATLRGEARGATFGAAAVGVLSRFSELKVMVTGPGTGEIGGARSLPGGYVYRTCTCMYDVYHPPAAQYIPTIAENETLFQFSVQHGGVC